jgi:hypothetical protein
MTTLEILKAGRAKIAKKENFVKGHYALDSEGMDVLPMSSEACRFCSEGAIHASVRLEDHRYKDYALAALKEEMLEGIITFNDSHTHAEVLNAWDRAITKHEIETN